MRVGQKRQPAAILSQKKDEKMREKKRRRSLLINVLCKHKIDFVYGIESTPFFIS